MTDALTALQQMFDAYQDNPLLDPVNTDPTQHAQVAKDYATTRDSYYACLNKSFQNNDPAVKALVKQATAVAAELTKLKKQLGDITTAIGYGTQAAGIAAKLAAL